MNKVRVGGVIRNSFYQPENELSEKQIEFINNNSTLMERFTKEEEREILDSVKSLFRCAANRKNTKW